MRASRVWTARLLPPVPPPFPPVSGHRGAPTAAPAAPPPGRPKKQKDVAQEVDGQGEFIQKMNDQVFSFGELGFQEFETSKYLTDILKKNGFTVQENLAGIPTAWMASWGSGKPVIALGSDIDCIPQASQKPGVAYHDPIIEGAPGHGEGHNSGMPLQHHGRARREEDHGARASPGHAAAVAGRRGRAARLEGVFTCAPAPSRTSTSRSSRTSARTCR